MRGKGWGKQHGKDGDKEKEKGRARAGPKENCRWVMGRGGGGGGSERRVKESVLLVL